MVGILRSQVTSDTWDRLTNNAPTGFHIPRPLTRRSNRMGSSNTSLEAQPDQVSLAAPPEASTDSDNDGENSAHKPDNPHRTRSDGVPDTTRGPGSMHDTTPQRLSAASQHHQHQGYLLIATTTIVVASFSALLLLGTYLYVWTQQFSLLIQIEVYPSLRAIEEILKQLQQILN